MCGKKVVKGTRVAALRLQILEWQRELRANGRLQIATGTHMHTNIHAHIPTHSHIPVFTTTGTGKIPWQLTREAVEVIDARIQRIVYPHGPTGCSKDGAGFIKNFNRVRRISQKLLAFLVILPTVLRDYVPEVRDGLRKLILGLRILEGRCVNAKEVMELKVPKCSRPLLAADIDKVETLIIEGLSMLEGTTTTHSFSHSIDTTHSFSHSIDTLRHVYMRVCVC